MGSREYGTDDYGTWIKKPGNSLWLINKILRWFILLFIIYMTYSMISTFVIKTKYKVKTLNPEITVEQPVNPETNPTPATTLKKL